MIELDAMEMLEQVNAYHEAVRRCVTHGATTEQVLARLRRAENELISWFQENGIIPRFPAITVRHPDRG
jgi:hypothetical protein